MTTLLDPPVAPARRTPKRWTKAEYHRVVETGGLEGQRVYLYRGELIQMPATGALHIQGVKRLNY